MKQFKAYIAIFLVGVISACQQGNKLPEKQINESIQGTILSSSINSLPNEKNSLYLKMQSKQSQFKTSSPFIEIMGDYEERLWFTSSNIDSNYVANVKTNNYQQIYYAQRSIYNGVCAMEGWETVTRLEAISTTIANQSKVAAFNKASKGTPAVAGNTLILACDQFGVENESEFKDLWTLTIEGDRFLNPFRMNKLSGEFTWESQPTLSANGKHLFFVSNRRVDADSFIVASEAGADLNIYYSFKNFYGWTTPKLLKEIYSKNNEITPQLNSQGDVLYFSSNKNGDFDIYSVKIILDDEKGGYQFLSEVNLFEPYMFNDCESSAEAVMLNDDFNQKYPFQYYNPDNVDHERAFYWISDHPSSMGSSNVYGAAMPEIIDYYVTIIDENEIPGKDFVMPSIVLSGDKTATVEGETAHFELFKGDEYQIKGGSLVKPYEDIYDSTIYSVYNWIGYADPDDEEVCEGLHLNPIQGPFLESEKTKRFGRLPLDESAVYDTILIAKAWERTSPCPNPFVIEPTYSSIPYFQAGYWKVNTTENLNTALEELHNGFQITGDLPISNPVNGIIRYRSDYMVNDLERTLFPIRPADGYQYSIANASWIELHPNNYYWGDHPYFSWVNADRMEGRIKRIEQYYDYAEKVEQNLNDIADTIINNFIEHLIANDLKQVLIEVFAVSDQRRLTEGWYIGDTIEYRESDYIMQDVFTTHKVRIIPPLVNELRKQLTITSFSNELNEQGNNGSMLGSSLESNQNNTNLSRLRAYFGYKELIKRLENNSAFKDLVSRGLVALPDNDVPYDEAKLIFITNSKNVEVIEPNHPFPAANNQNQQGFYDYDEVRRIEVQVRALE